MRFLASATVALVLSLPWPVAAAETCRASYYGAYHHGRLTASGERFSQWAMTAAHRRLRLGTRVRVTYRGRSVVVRINDRGPFVGGRCIDLSKGAAARLGMLRAGVGAVRVEVIK